MKTMKAELVCEGCKRSVEELLEWVAIDSQLMFKITRCRDCMEISMEQMHKAEFN